MGRKWLCLLLAFLLCFPMAGCSKQEEKEPLPPVEPPNPPDEEPPEAPDEQEKEPPEAEEPDPAKLLLDKMSLEEKVGQMMIAGFPGKTATGDVATLIEELHVGGVILFKENVGDIEQLISLQNGLRERNKGGVPLFVAVDEEGGRVSRMPEGVRRLPAALEIGASGKVEGATAAGDGLAKQLALLGYNLDFAPDLDIPIDLEKGAIRNRAYGQDTETVSKFGNAMAQALQNGGVIACAKHFPGHGNTVEDSHKTLPVVPLTEEELFAQDLLPFQAAMDAGIDMVMVGHILVPALDEKNGASTSPAIISGLLRDKLGYEGVIITDELSMGGVTANATVPEAALAAVKAGVDIVLISGSLKTQEDTIDGIVAAVQSGDVSEKQINASVLRILELKVLRGLTDEKIPETDLAKVNACLEPFWDLFEQ